MRGFFVWSAGLLLGLVLGLSAAHCHEDSDPFASWYRSLHEPDNPISSCCGVADAFDVDEYYPSETKEGGFRARVGVQWYDVPPEKVNWNDVNPTGVGVIFLSRPENGYSGQSQSYVYCFVPNTGV
jgi:hypothetical protein